MRHGYTKGNIELYYMWLTMYPLQYFVHELHVSAFHNNMPPKCFSKLDYRQKQNVTVCSVWITLEVIWLLI